MVNTDMIKRYNELRASGISDEQALTTISTLETMISAVADKMATKEELSRVREDINRLEKSLTDKFSSFEKSLNDKFSSQEKYFADKFISFESLFTNKLNSLESVLSTKVNFILWVLGACALCVIGACFKQYFPWG
jgi:hypothetical protein